jgi:hypothetical protein
MNKYSQYIELLYDLLKGIIMIIIFLEIVCFFTGLMYLLMVNISSLFIFLTLPLTFLMLYIFIKLCVIFLW